MFGSCLITIPFKISRMALATGWRPQATTRKPDASELRLMER
jgi:hypothetical protein